MLLSRYQNIDFILSLDLPQFVDLLLKAFEERKKDKAFQMWLTLYANMTKENFMSFEDYYLAMQRPKDTRSAAQIVEDVEKSIKQIEWSKSPV